MTTLEIKAIVESLRVYCKRYPSQNKAATSLGVSKATISQILSGNHELISAEMWRGIAAKIGYKGGREWNIVQTSVYSELYKLLYDAQQDSGVSAITGDAGCGKSETSKRYAAENKRVYRLECSEYWNRKTFMLELLEIMGINAANLTVNEMMNQVVENLKSEQSPLIILDEADKLSDQVLYFFITLYNKLEDCCGIVLLATNFLDKRLKRGVANKIKGYNEIYSRVGRKTIPLDGNTAENFADICQANGLTDDNTIKEIIDDSEGDLRRIKKTTRASIKRTRENGKESA
ncbi:AAA family ATPase [Dysgonomonas sp. ZJ279]|uniref:AAA family ATPase n=1 Tax=Dysgonomonas sp. ZJ279 TaxID=2709796 RepID=UPI0013EC4B30|nr:AAA family ATPase [Dysgonomonas sp. ZJ279]